MKEYIYFEIYDKDTNKVVRSSVIGATKGYLETRGQYLKDTAARFNERQEQLNSPLRKKVSTL